MPKKAECENTQTINSLSNSCVELSSTFVNESNSPILAPAFIKNENLLPTTSQGYSPPSGPQLRDFVTWSGISKKKLGYKLYVSDRKWTWWLGAKGKERSIPAAVWRFLLSRFEFTPRVKAKRQRPSDTFRKQILDGEKVHWLSVSLLPNHSSRANHTLLINLNLELCGDSIPVEILKLTPNSEVSPNGKLRIENLEDSFDSCPWGIRDCSVPEGLNETVLRAIHDYIQKDLWRAVWRLQLFETLEPSCFLSRSNLAFPFSRDATLPSNEQLLLFFRWTGHDPESLANLSGMTAKHFRYLILYSSKYDREEILDELELDPNNPTLLNRLEQTRISKHQWYLLLTSFGLTSDLPTLKQEPSTVKLSRTMELGEEGMNSARKLHLDTVIDWYNQEQSKIKVCNDYRCSEHGKYTGPAISSSLNFTLLEREGNTFVTLEGDATEYSREEVPKQWVIFHKSGFEELESYIDKRLWRGLWDFIRKEQLSKTS